MNPKDYILSAAELANGESLFIPVLTKKEQMSLATELCAHAKSFCADIDPSISLAVCKTFQDKKLWVKIIKDKAPEMLYVKGVDGTIKKLKIKGE